MMKRVCVPGSLRLLPLLFLGLVLAGCPEIPGGGGGEGLDAMELEAFDLINVERSAAGVDPLVMDSGLRAVARAHSEDMVAREFFSHDNPDGASPFDRIHAAGIEYSRAGENIAWNNFPNPVEKAVDGWMNSTGHRNNILNGEFTLTGMGVAGDDTNGYYFTQVFTHPLEKGGFTIVVKEFEMAPPPLALYP